MPCLCKRERPLLKEVFKFIARRIKGIPRDCICNVRILRPDNEHLINLFNEGKDLTVVVYKKNEK